jgi:hypothetical protein
MALKTSLYNVVDEEAVISRNGWLMYANKKTDDEWNAPLIAYITNTASPDNCM